MTAAWIRGLTWGAAAVVGGTLACAGKPQPPVLHEPAAPAPPDLEPAAPVVDPGPKLSIYREPAPDVVKLVDAPPTPWAILAPHGERLLLARYRALPSIARVSEPFEALAGIRIDAKRFAERRTRFYEDLSWIELRTGQEVRLPASKGAQFGPPVWAPDGRSFAVAKFVENAVELWVADVVALKFRKVTERTLNTTFGPGFTWASNSHELLVWLVPRPRPELPPPPDVPWGPVVDESSGQPSTTRTYQDLLRNEHDAAKFERLATSELAVVSVKTRVTKPLRAPAIYTHAETSPDGRYVLVYRTERPFSYTVPWERFARSVEVVDRTGKTIRVVAQQNLAESIPIGGVRKGPRAITWQPTAPATLVWNEALDGGDPKREVEHRGQLVALSAPFTDAPRELARLQHRFSDLAWMETPGQALITEYDRDRRWTTTWLFDFTANGGTPVRLFDRSIRDDYSDPGTPVTQTAPDGSSVVRVDDGAIYLSGSGASPEGRRPFLDRFDLATATASRVWQSPEDEHASFVGFVAERDETDALESFIVRTESKTQSPNYRLIEHGSTRALTAFPHPHPELAGVGRQVLRYRRADGVELSGVLYTPADWDGQTRLPLVVWAYPLEYSDDATAGQIRAAPNRFVRLAGTSVLMFLTQGYAVLDDAAMPVVGPPETMNDTFIEQIVSSARAAIDAAVDAGVADRERVGVVGHSYGAFMVANLLAHSDLFRAGIARSGAYNRTLTPFGYQSERRTLWEAPQTYLDVSPLYTAHRIDEPLLLVHGQIDDNSGTYPLQSERMFHALKGNGKKARLVLLPQEAHTYVGRESVLHVLAETFEWFDRYVKNGAPRPPGAEQAAGND